MNVAGQLRAMFGEPMSVISSCIRGMIKAAPGNDLIAADFSAIEARGLAWLAGQDDVLDLFRAGEDVYCHEASTIYGRTITKADKTERQVGKTSILALGYGGGIGAYGTMARSFELDLEPVYDALVPTFTADEVERAEYAYEMYKRRASVVLPPKAGVAADVIKQRWRRKNRRIVEYWGELNAAAIAAVRSPHEVKAAGLVAFKVNGSFLWCRLPSGRKLCYPYPRLAEKTTPWGEQKLTLHYKRVHSVTNQWGETHTYGGKLAENVTQAVCRDLLADAIVRCEAAGYPIILHVHDEIVTEVRKGTGDLREFEKLCSMTPDWAKGLPITAEGWRGERYRK